MIEVRIYTITLDVVTSNYCDLKKEFESTFFFTSSSFLLLLGEGTRM